MERSRTPLGSRSGPKGRLKRYGGIQGLLAAQEEEMHRAFPSQEELDAEWAEYLQEYHRTRYR